MNNNNIDKLFRKALKDRSSEPPPYIWENIEKRLANRHRKVMLWWFRGAAAVVLAGAFMWLVELRHQEPELLYNMPTAQILNPEPDFVTQSKAENILQEEFQTQNQNKNTTTPRQEDAILIAHATTASVEKRQMLSPVSTPVSNHKTELNTSTTPRISLVGKTIRKDFIPLTSKVAFENNKEYRSLLADNEPRKEKEEKNMKISLSGHVAPVYSSGTYSSSVKSPRGSNYSNNQMEGLMNVSGGVKISFTTNKKLSLQTGLFYSRMGQRTEDHTIPTRSPSGATPDPNDYVSTPLGNIKNRTKAVAFRSSDAITLSSVNSSDENIEQIFGTLEIPLMLRYRINDNKLKFSVSGGFSSNIIIDNKVYLEQGNDREYVGSTEGIRNFNVSTDLGLGIEYPISRKVKVMLEPGFKYYMQSLSRNSDINFKPYMFSLSTGIGIEF